MDKKIKRAAIKFYKLAGKKPTVKNVVSALQKLGYDVILFNTPQGDKLLISLGLSKDNITANAFTTGGSARFVFLNNNISNSDKLYALLHEAGHIMLGHVGTDAIKWMDNCEMESNANAFAAEVISSVSSTSIYNTIIAAIIIIATSLGLGYCLHRPETVTVFNEHLNNTVSLTNNIVYITKAGKKYHSPNCIYVKNKDCAMIDKEQAQHIYEPCSVCNP